MAYVRDAVFKSLFPCFQKHSHASFLMFHILLDKGVDSIRWRGTGMVWSYIESRSSVIAFRIIPLTRSDVNPAERHRLVLLTVMFVSLIVEIQQKGFRCEHSLFTR